MDSLTARPAPVDLSHVTPPPPPIQVSGVVWLAGRGGAAAVGGAGLTGGSGSARRPGVDLRCSLHLNRPGEWLPGRPIRLSTYWLSKSNSVS